MTTAERIKEYTRAAAECGLPVRVVVERGGLESLHTSNQIIHLAIKLSQDVS